MHRTTPPRTTPTLSRRGPDTGMTLTEVMVSIGLLGLILTVVVGAITVVFRSESGLQTVVAESHDVQQAVNYFHLDVQSGPVLVADYITEGATGTGCSDTGTANVFRFDDGDRRIAYELATTGLVGRLDRHECSWNGSSWDEVSIVNIADQLDASGGDPVTVAVVADATQPAEVDHFVMSFSQTNGAEDVAASPRAETGLTVAVPSCSENPTEAMLGFGSFVDGDVSLNSSTTIEGPLAVGGTLSWTNGVEVAQHDHNNTNGFSKVGLYAVDLDWGAGTPGNELKLYTGPSKTVMLGTSFDAGGTNPKPVYADASHTGAYISIKNSADAISTSANPIDFATQVAEFEACAEQMALLPDSCTGCAEYVTPLDQNGNPPYPGSGSMRIKFESPNTTQVLSMPESKLSDINDIKLYWGSSLSASRPLVVNIDDDDGDGDVYFSLIAPDWQSVGNSKFVIYNFPNATGTVTVAQDVYGVVYAPYAEVVTQSQVHGMVVAHSWVHNGGTVQNDLPKIFNGKIGWD